MISKIINIGKVITFDLDQNDVIEFNSTTGKWGVVWDASNPDSTQHYLTNINTGIQYRFNGIEWVKSYEGIYVAGKWTLVL